MRRYLSFLERTRGLRFAAYEELWEWSVRDADAFWSSQWEFFEVQAHAPYTAVLADERMPGARWFPGARLNYAEHALRRRDDAPALLFASETRSLERLSRRELYGQVAAVAASLRALGVGPGDRVASFMPLPLLLRCRRVAGQSVTREANPVVEPTWMTDSGSAPTPGASLIERRARRIANSRSVTLGLALTFVGLSLVGAIVMRFADEDNFPSIGLAVWWALQTVTTVGYGDVVPTTTFGRVVGGLVMVMGVSFIAFLTATVTSTVIQRGQAAAQEAEPAQREQTTQTIIDALTETRHAITELDKRLDHIESKITNTPR